MTLLIKICYIMLLTANLDAMPTTSPTTPLALRSLIFKTLDWKTEIQICGLDFVKMMTTMCTVCDEGHCNIEEGYTQSDILHLASQCCIDYCKLETMKLFCEFQSVIIDYMVEPTTTTRKPETTTREEGIIYRKEYPTGLGILAYLPGFASIFY